jgi:hypothetical protein
LDQLDQKILFESYEKEDYAVGIMIAAEHANNKSKHKPNSSFHLLLVARLIRGGLCFIDSTAFSIDS